MKRFMILEWDPISRKYCEMGTQNVDCRFINRKSKIKNRKSSVLSVALCILSVAGCSNPKVKESPTIKIEQLTQENTKLTDQVEKLTSQNKDLKNQIKTLSGLPENIRFESIDRLGSIKIGRYTGFFDKNNDGKKETLIVYIQPIDKQGDIIKEFGSVEVQLWDLNKPENKALLDQWKIGLDELKKLWFATVVSSSFRLTFNVADIIENLQGPLTVKVTFTDYLTGKVFTKQKVIEAP